MGWDETSFPARNKSMKQVYSPSSFNFDSIDLSKEDTTADVGFKAAEENDKHVNESNKPVGGDEQESLDFTQNVITNCNMEEPGWRYPQRERSNPNWYAYVARKSGCTKSQRASSVSWND